MSIAFITEPTEISLAKNEMLLRARSNKVLKSEGTAAVATISIPNNPASAEWFSFSFDGILIKFTFSASGDIDDFVLPLNSGSWSTAYITTLRTEVQKNYYIKQYLKVTQSGANIIFTQRQRGSRFNFTAETNISGASWTITNGTDPVYFDTEILLDIYVRKNRVFKKLPTQSANIDTSGFFQFDIAEHLLSQTAPQVPAIHIAKDENSPMVQSMTSHNLEYYYVMAEHYDGLARRHYTSPEKRAIRAGVDDIAFLDGFRDPARNFLFPQKKWLTNRPTNREITINQPEYLSIILPEQTTEDFLIIGIIIKAKLYFKNGTEITKTIATLPVSNFTTVLVNTSPINNLNINTHNSGSPLTHYTVWAENTAEEKIGEDVNYAIIPGDYLDLFLIYENSWGGYDTLRTFGEREAFMEVEKQGLERPRALGYNQNVKTIFSKLEGYQEKVKVSTGAISKSEFELLIDLLKSEDVYIFHEVAFLPVEITPEKYDWGTTAENTRNLVFELSRSKKEINYLNPAEFDNSAFTPEFTDPFTGTGNTGTPTITANGSVSSTTTATF
jgi:hypothetical protein